MIKVELYTLMDRTVCTIEAASGFDQHDDGTHLRWVSLAYVTGPLLSHDETGGLGELLGDAISAAEPRAAELGGWAALV